MNYKQHLDFESELIKSVPWKTPTIAQIVIDYINKRIFWSKIIFLLITAHKKNNSSGAIGRRKERQFAPNVKDLFKKLCSITWKRRYWNVQRMYYLLLVFCYEIVATEKKIHMRIAFVTLDILEFADFI